MQICSVCHKLPSRRQHSDDCFWLSQKEVSLKQRSSHLCLSVGGLQHGVSHLSLSVQLSRSVSAASRHFKTTTILSFYTVAKFSPAFALACFCLAWTGSRSYSQLGLSCIINFEGRRKIMTIACTFFTRFRLLMPRTSSADAHVRAAQIPRNFIAMDNEIKLSLTFLRPTINQLVFSQPCSVFLTSVLQCTIELFNLETQPLVFISFARCP